MVGDLSGAQLPACINDGRAKQITPVWVICDSGGLASLRDVRGNRIENSFADEPGAMGMAIHMVEQEKKWGTGKGFYFVCRGVRG